jgi:hypothetical protein
MDERTEIKAVELVRSIRDRQVELLSGKSKEETIEFFHQAGEAARREIRSPDWAGIKRLHAESLQN